MRFRISSFDALHRRLAAIGAGNGIDDSRFFANVRDVAVVVSSSRSGSSVFMEMLRRTGKVLVPRGEINPFLRLCGLDPVRSGTDSDALAAHHACGPAVARLEEYLWAEVGLPVDCFGAEEVDQFIRDLSLRLMIQWPEEDIQPKEVEGWVRESLSRLYRHAGWAPHRFEDAEAFYRLLLYRLRSRHPRVNPFYYDLRAPLLRPLFGGVPEPEGSPTVDIVEEPPFVTVSPSRRPTPEEVARLPLVIKAPSNAYRLPFLKGLFPNARFRLIHLTRNPAAAVNGLIDGWRFPGFHAHAFDQSLAITGVEAYDSHWWKFDLPPGWRNFVGMPLGQVCAFQWRAAHEAILEYIEQEDVECLRVRFEDVTGRTAKRLEVVRDLLAWLEVSSRDPQTVTHFETLPPPTMATQSPRPGRWRERLDVLEELLEDPRVTQLSERLGYSDQASWT